jgi:hypothetical protein
MGAGTMVKMVRTLALVLLAVLAAAFLALVLPAEPATVHEFAWTGAWKSCLWCGRHLRTGQVYFDTDRCGRKFGEQLAVRGLRVFKEEVVDVNGDVRPHPP